MFVARSSTLPAAAWRTGLGSAVLWAETPFTVSYPAEPHEIAYLSVWALALLAANLVLLRLSLRPLSRLTARMQSIDLLQPGERLSVSGADELQGLLTAFNDMLDRLERERQVSSRRTIDREEAERRQLAGELHDEVGQGMTAVLLALQSALADLSGDSRTHVLDALSIARDTLDEVRGIARSLRPSVLDDLGLPYAIHALADVTEEQGGVEVERRIEFVLPPLPEPGELALYRIAQEAVTNALRHADARRIEICLQPKGRGVYLEIRDDGRGMLYANEVEGGGMRGMRERAVAVGTDLQIESRPGSGTRVWVSVEGCE